MARLFTTNDDTLKIPESLKGLARQAAEKVLEVIGPKADTGGTKMFYTPQEWQARGEKYGTSALVVIVHDGGDQDPYFNWNSGGFKMQERMAAELAKIGCFPEQCTGWYSAIYKD